MKLYEAQTKALLRHFGLPVPRSGAITCAEYVLKAQTLASERYKQGLIKFVTAENLPTVVASLKKESSCEILVEEKEVVEKEIYVSFTVVNQGIGFLLGKCGGVDVENEENFLTITLGTKWQASYDCQIRSFLASSYDLGIFKRLHEFLLAYDLIFLEINPLAVTKDGWKILDAKAMLDDNALYRQGQTLEIMNKALSVEINTFSNYIPLDGDIACVINGAGLAMATQDAIVAGGGQVANFLDLGGGTSIEKVEEVLSDIFNSKKLSSVLFNLFGGIVNCKTVATSILKCLAKDSNLEIIVRMEGSGAQEAKQLLRASKNIIVAETFDEAIALVLKCEKAA